MNTSCLTPPEQPLAMPEQDFSRAFRDSAAQGLCAQPQAALWRVLAFSPPLAATGLLIWIMSGWFADDGFMALEMVLLSLIAFSFFWISFTVSTVLLGLWSLWRHRPDVPRGPVRPLRTALLIPVYNEDPSLVLGNARSMLEDLESLGGSHSYAMYILSDTQNDAIARQERAGIAALQVQLGQTIPIHYRRRVQNSGRKAGNIADWVRRWGAGFEAMLVLDADSLMTGKAVRRLTDAMSRDPGAGLIQSLPQLIGAQSLFGRMQQFASGAYGLALAEGLARWAGQDGNYWGHNAIIRTRAFAACAGLPPLPARRGRTAEIMSHDFVEAGLMRRAGWRVRFLPRIRGSYEETPPTLTDHILRDRRWCQGNLQHLRLLGARGFCPISRFHLLHGAVSYLMAPLWFTLLVIWALVGRSESASVLTYFSAENPTMPSWPDMSQPRHVLVILLIYGLLLAPKLLAVAALPLTGSRFSDYGGPGRFAASALCEILLAVLYAPVLMVQQMIAVFRAVLGLQRGWSPQARAGGQYGLCTLGVTHAVETISGVLLWAGIWAGIVSLWLAPIALSLALAVPLSALSGLPLRRGLSRWMATREVLAEPAIIRAAGTARTELKTYLTSLQREAAE